MNLCRNIWCQKWIWGISIFMGAFFCINDILVTNMLRSVAQSAPGYSVLFANKGICQAFAQVMSNLQKVIAN